MPIAGELYYFLHEGGNSTRPPVVLIHGTGGSHLSWPPELRRLSGYRVFTVDLPGHGKSSGVVRQSVGDLARVLVGFMDDVSIWKAVFIGHSLGGAVALTMALEYPERTAGLGLIGCGLRLPVPASLLDHASNPATSSLARQALLENALGSRLDPHLRELSTHRLAEVRPAVLQGNLIACDAFDVTASAGDVHVPSLVICGNEDHMVPPQFSRALANAIPGAALQVVDEAGHTVVLEQSRRVAALISVFLLTVPYVPGG